MGPSRSYCRLLIQHLFTTSGGPLPEMAYAIWVPSGARQKRSFSCPPARPLTRPPPLRPSVGTAVSTIWGAVLGRGHAGVAGRAWVTCLADRTGRFDSRVEQLLGLHTDLWPACMNEI